MSKVAYVRKTDTVRREPGGLERAVLMLVVDGYDTSFKIAQVLDTSIDNVNGALSRLHARGNVVRTHTIPVQWFPSEEGRSRVANEALWL